jgi:hypothetical protein
MASAVTTLRARSKPQALAGERQAREREQQLIREAIAMVASGASSRVVVAGIGFGELLLDPARRWALEAGVRANPLRKRDGSGVDIAIEVIYE